MLGKSHCRARNKGGAVQFQDLRSCAVPGRCHITVVIWEINKNVFILTLKYFPQFMRIIFAMVI